MGTILYTTDAGTTWTAQVSGTGLDLLGVSCEEDGMAWAVGINGTVLVYDSQGGGK